MGNPIGVFFRRIEMLTGRHFIEPDDFTLEEMDALFSLAEKIEREPEYLRDSCKGKLLGILFFEPSARRA
jgi:aspartate carbamoyltransferase catalytic subunit